MNQQTYAHILDEIREKIITYQNISPSQINAFFKSITLQVFTHDGTSGYVMLTAENAFIQKWVRENFLTSITKALKDLYNADFTVDIEVFKTSSIDQNNAPKRSEQPVQSEETHTAASSSAQKASAYNPDAMKVAPEHAKHNNSKNVSAQHTNSQHADTLQSDDSHVDAPPSIIDGTEEFTFENFVRGDSNNLALQRAIFVAQNPMNSRTNPLFIYGESGLGKTHLLLAIKNYINQNDPKLKVVYVDTMDFVNEYVDAGRSKDKSSDYSKIREKYETTDVLLIDDVQNLQGKGATLNGLFQILNTMLKYGRQIVLAADRQPRNIDIDDRYQSRFSQGGTVQIYPPEFETKYGIIKSYVDECAHVDGIPYQLSNEVMDYIARTAGPNIRDLKGGINDILFTMRDKEEDSVSLAEVKSLLQDRLSATTEQRLTISDIQKNVAKFFQIDVAALKKKTRTRNIVHARQIAMYFCQTLLEKTEAEIGKAFERNHSTVDHSIKLIDERLKDDRDLQEEIEVLQQMITGQ